MRGLRRERPGEGDVLEAGARDVAEVVGEALVLQHVGDARDATALRGMMDALERRAHRLTVVAAQAIGEDNRVLGLLLERDDGPDDERVGLALVPGEEVVDARDPLVSQGIRVIEDAVEVAIERGAVGRLGEACALLGGLEREVALAGLGIAREVAERIAHHHGVVAVAHVEEDGQPGGEVDDVDRVVGEVVLVALHPRGDVLEVDGGGQRIGAGRAVEGDADGRGDPPALHRGEVLARVALHEGGRDQAHVDAASGSARGIGERSDVVGERDLGQRPVRGVELHDRPVAVRRPAQPVGRGVDPAGRAQRQDAGRGDEERGAVGREVHGMPAFRRGDRGD